MRCALSFFMLCGPALPVCMPHSCLPAVQHAAEEAAALAALGLPTGFAESRVSTSSHCVPCFNRLVAAPCH
jgi:hypothetical protein